MDQHADIRRAPAGRHFQTGEHLDHLFFRTHRIHRRHRNYLDRAAGRCRSRAGRDHRGKRLRLVVLDADQNLACTGGMCDQADAFDDLRRALLHQTVVAGQIGLAFTAVHDQRMHFAVARKVQLYRRRKCRAAESDDAGGGDARGDLGRCQRKRIGGRLQVIPGIFAIGFDSQGRHRQAGRMRSGKVADRHHAAGSGRMHRRRYRALAGSKQLPLFHLFADCDQMPGRRADMLLQRYIQPLRQRQDTNRRLRRQVLAAFRMHAAAQLEQFHADLPPGRPKGVGSPLGGQRTNVSWGLFIWPPPAAPSTRFATSPAAQPCVWPRWDTRQRTCRRRYRPP